VTTSRSDRQAQSTRALAVADGFTSVVLLLVVAAVAWMTVADALPASWRLLSLEAEILGILALLSVALGAVSALALVHTRHRL
jgi:hypothetical protein